MCPGKKNQQTHVQAQTEISGNCLPPDCWLCKPIHHLLCPLQMLIVAKHSNWSKEMPPDSRQSYWLWWSLLSLMKRKTSKGWRCQRHPTLKMRLSPQYRVEGWKRIEIKTENEIKCLMTWPYVVKCSLSIPWSHFLHHHWDCLLAGKHCWNMY